jgi:hypothetical protein
MSMLWFRAAQVENVFCPVIVFRFESTVDGEIWHLKPFQKEFIKFQSIL